MAGREGDVTVLIEHIGAGYSRVGIWVAKVHMGREIRSSVAGYRVGNSALVGNLKHGGAPPSAVALKVGLSSELALLVGTRW